MTSEFHLKQKSFSRYTNQLYSVYVGVVIYKFLYNTYIFATLIHTDCGPNLIMDSLFKVFMIFEIGESGCNPIEISGFN